MSQSLELEIKQLIIESLGLEDISPDDIETDAPLFNEGLGLDSVDALELGLAIQKKFNFQMDSQKQNVRENFYSVATLAKFVESQQK